MQVLRRTADNVVQFTSLGLLAAVFAVERGGLVGFVVAVPLAVGAVRGLRSGLYVGDDAVVVRNLGSTRRIERPDVDRVDLARAGRPPLPAIVIRRHSGPPVPLWCLMPARRGRRGEEALVPVMAEVQRALGLLGD
jgi:hypothetical protein